MPLVGKGIVIVDALGEVAIQKIFAIVDGEVGEDFQRDPHIGGYIADRNEEAAENFPRGKHFELAA
jgi:hypothetical protein